MVRDGTAFAGHVNLCRDMNRFFKEPFVALDTSYIFGNRTGLLGISGDKKIAWSMLFWSNVVSVISIFCQKFQLFHIGWMPLWFLKLRFLFFVSWCSLCFRMFSLICECEPTAHTAVQIDLHPFIYTLHYTTLHYITIRYNTLQQYFITLHYITIRYNTLQYNIIMPS